MSIEPHGGTLVDRRVTGAKRDSLISEAAKLPKIELEDRQVSDLDMIAVGAMSPLTGFLREKDYRGVVEKMRLGSGTIWPMPICLRVDAAKAAEIKDRVALYHPDGKLLAIMDVSEKYKGDKKVEAKSVYGTDEEAPSGSRACTTPTGSPGATTSPVATASSNPTPGSIG
jgi:sulfate adenylyltransferase